MVSSDFKVFLTDLDNTLYPAEVGLFKLVDERINRFMVDRVGIPSSLVNALRRRFFKVYGTTLMGLMVHYGVDPEEYLSYVHDVPVERVLRKDERLRRVLESLDMDRYIFTNASSEHAERVLSCLGVCDLFSGIFDIRSVGFFPKSTVDAHRVVFDHLKGYGQGIIFVDDYPPNLVPAKVFGFITVLVGDGNGAFVDYRVKNFYEVVKLPCLAF